VEKKCDGAHTPLFLYLDFGRGRGETIDFYSEMDIFEDGIIYNSDENSVLFSS
jgi:hypothetical protein